VKPAALITDLEVRGVRLMAVGETLRVDAPRGVLTAADRKALLAHKPAILAKLRADASRASTATEHSWADGVPDGPCGLCGHQPPAEVRDWPAPGAVCWLCLACAVRPAPSLEAVYASLSVDEGGRLLDEARAGDPLARLLLTLVPVSGAA
jgi:hypothetical protein